MVVYLKDFQISKNLSCVGVKLKVKNMSHRFFLLYFQLFFLCNSAWRTPKQLSQNASATQTNFGKYSLEFSLGEGSCCETRHSWRTQAFYLHVPCDGPRLDFGQYGDPGIWKNFTYIRARSFIFQKEIFPGQWGYQQIITFNYCGWFGTDIEYTIYDDKQYRGPLPNIRVGLP